MYDREKTRSDDFFRISDRNPIRAQIELIEKRLRLNRVVTLSALDTNIEKLLEIVHIVEKERTARVLRIATSTIRKSSEEGQVFIPRLTADVTLNIDPRMMAISNFTIVFNYFFLPGFLASNPDFETTDALDPQKEKELLVSINTVKRARLPTGIGMAVIKEKKQLLSRFEKVQSNKSKKSYRRHEQESFREASGVYVDPDTKPGYMNQFELLSWLTSVFKDYIAAGRKSVGEVLEEFVKDNP